MKIYCCLWILTTQFKETFLPLFLPLAVGVGPASVVLGNLVAGKRIAQAAGRDLGMIEDQDLVRKVDTKTINSLFITFIKALTLYLMPVVLLHVTNCQLLTLIILTILKIWTSLSFTLYFFSS